MPRSWQAEAVERPKNRDIFPNHLHVRNTVRKLMNNITVLLYTVFSVVTRENQIHLKR